ncbi:hypothetical protein BDP55DRAFT_724887 [Colletotrichum godetiae]|uniref:DNA repair protein Dds20/Mei5 n=1 Tax=Colletotrichum godetiae TaxID=1209918 RepID=A0AAJ0F2B5_9PEZI|nr:uncharacterized protein BDP55DRAFT_724887 [Colletotrichum godetiae]KAK1690327.1 hypothetical protein BDP55DRAFT_724887 [Colletotrichum godetiae]
MFTPAAKRRRVDAANETLRKPFRSPLVRDRDPGPGPGPDRNRDGSTAAAADPAAEEEEDDDDGTAPTASTAAAVASSPSVRVATGVKTGGVAGFATTTTPRQGTTWKATPVKQKQTISTPTPTRRPFSVPRPHISQTGVSPSPLRTTAAGFVGARRTQAPGLVGGSMKSEREAEGREEILRQAERIRGVGVGAVGGTSAGEGGETDEELVELIGKWRAASRIAAEEVFEGSRERVEGMGGLKAWRRARREDEVRFRGMMEEGEKGVGKGRGCEEWEEGDDGGGGDEGEGEGEEEEEEEEEFTMGTMLRSMNIDFEIIGYDEDTGWWRDG